MPDQNHVKYVPAGTGPMHWGPGDRDLLRGTLVIQVDEQTFQAPPRDFTHRQGNTVYSFRKSGGMHQEVVP